MRLLGGINKKLNHTSLLRHHESRSGVMISNLSADEALVAMPEIATALWASQ